MASGLHLVKQHDGKRKKKSVKQECDAAPPTRALAGPSIDEAKFTATFVLP